MLGECETEKDFKMAYYMMAFPIYVNCMSKIRGKPLTFCRVI